MTPTKTMATTLAKIKQRAYWHVEFFPTEFIEDALPFAEIPEIMRSTAIAYRGWDYPHITIENIDNRQECYPIQNSYYESWIDWSYYKEVWRTHKSAKFSHLVAIHEQWYDEFEEILGSNPYPNLEPKYLDIIDIVFKVTEMIEFIRGYANLIEAADNFVFRVKIKNSANNELTLFDRGRLPLSMVYKNRSEVIIGYDGVVNKVILNSKETRDALGTQIIQSVFRHFDGWQWSDESIAAERQRLIERRF